MKDKLVELLKQVREGTISHGGIAGRLEDIIKQHDLASGAKAAPQKQAESAEK